MEKDTTIPSKDEKISYETKSINETKSLLDTDLEKGLSEEEAQARLLKYGPNKLEEKKKKSWIRIFFEQMNDPMIFVLFGAIAITLGISIYETIKCANAGWINEAGQAINNVFLEVGDWPDIVIILAVVIMNSIIGTVQEIKAETSLEALKKMSSPETTVIRDGARRKIKSEELVIGDLIVLEEGDTIGADIRLVEAINLKCNESSLTGESVPVNKNADLVFTESVGIGDRKNMAYMSMVVSYGRGKGIVTATGMSTEIGKIATSLDEEDEQETPLQKVLAKLSKILGILTLAIVVAVLAIDIVWIFVNGQANNISEWIEAVLGSIALAVAAIPEGLPAVVTIVLSIGVQRMVKVNTIVKKLPSVETLGAVSVICSDKTGTLTQNKMTVVEAYTLNNNYFEKDFVKENTNEDLKLLAKGMSLCSNATVDEGLYGDPTEIALVVFANAFDMHKGDLEKALPRVDELPFDSVRKMMSTKHQLEDKKSTVFTKGALSSIIELSTKILDNGKVRDITAKDKEKILEMNKEYSLKALRVLALAYNEKDKIDENDLVFVGLVAMIDPARPEAAPAVQTLKEAGIITVMITGDHIDTAFAIARDLGIASDISQCMSGKDIDKLSKEELQEAVKTTRVFARVSPENKVSIVKAFQANGNICAMTGDGVNDAPSLKAADIGIAMGITGTDVAKGAADMVLTDDNFASIEKAVEEGRGIFANIKKTVIFLLSSNIAEVLVMMLIIIVGLKTPFLAIHLLWINLVTDSLPAIALGMDPKSSDIMRQQPRDPNEGIFAHGGMRDTIMHGLFITIAVIIAYLAGFWLNGCFTYEAIRDASEVVVHEAQTMAFTSLAFAELIHMVCMSDTDHSFINVFKKKNWIMLLAFFVGIVLQIFVILVPGVNDVFKTVGANGQPSLDYRAWLITGGLSIVPLIAHEIIVFIKYLIRKRKEK